MTRPDIEAVLQKLPGHVSQQLTNHGKESLEFLDSNLPADEQVQWLASAAPNSYDATECDSLLAITNSRLLFVAPLPQVLSWSLPSVTRVQSLYGAANEIETIFIDDSGGGEYQLGADGEWGPTFAQHAKRAVAEATLRNT